MGLKDFRDLVDSTLSKWLSRIGGPLKLTNELLRNSYEFQALLSGKDKLSLDGGVDVKFDALIELDTMSGLVEPWQVRTIKQTNHIRRGTVDWAFFEADWAVEEIESEINKGEAKLLDLIETRQEMMMTDAHNRLESLWWDSVGNHDKLGDGKKPFPGCKAWLTRDGLAVDGTSTVFGIDTSKHDRWLSRYAGPFGDNLNAAMTHDTSAPLTSGSQVRNRLQKAFRYVRFASPAGLKFADGENRKAKMRAIESQKIWTDEIGYATLERTADALGHGSDHLGAAELDRPDPVVKGIPVVFVESLGIGSAGIPSYAAHDGGRGNIVAGAHANTGEIYIVNCKYFKVVCKEGSAPAVKDLEFIPQQQVLWKLYRWILTTLCQSRQRQCLLWGFSAPIAA